MHKWTDIACYRIEGQGKGKQRGLKYRKNEKLNRKEKKKRER